MLLIWMLKIIVNVNSKDMEHQHMNWSNMHQDTVKWVAIGNTGNPLEFEYLQSSTFDFPTETLLVH
jgi:hypothetical protein